MNPRKDRMTPPELEALYRNTGDVEPESGLDRIVRARAEQASRDPSRNRRPAGRIPWLGGLVTASVAIIAIAVVLQQTPPGEPLHESLGPPEPGEPEAFMAPSLGAQSQQEVSTDAARARSEPLGEEDFPRQTHRAREVLPEAATETRPRPTAPSTDANDSTLDRITVTGSRLGSADRAALKSEDAVIDKLRELIEAGHIDEARRLLDQARELDPKLDLPEEIEQVLRRQDSDGPGAKPDSGSP